MVPSLYYQKLQLMVPSLYYQKLQLVVPSLYYQKLKREWLEFDFAVCKSQFAKTVLSLQREITRKPAPRSDACYYGVTVDIHGNILATKRENKRCFIEVHRYEDGLKFHIDSIGDKLKRPAGLTTTDKYSVYVCDLGNDLLKQYRYR